METTVILNMRNSFYILLIVNLLMLISCGEQKPKLIPTNIPVYKTKARDVPIYQEFVGQTLGFKDIAIPARVEGYLEGIHFTEGAEINEGDLLYTLESQQYEALVAEKMSMVAEQNTLLANAKSELNRIRPLAEENAVSQSDLDSATARYKAAIASVDAAKANLDAAEIQLGYTKIYSPISGIIGKTKAKVGDLVGKNPNPVILNTVSSIDTVLVQFFITETAYLEAARRYLSTGEKPGEHKVELQLILADGSIYQHKGKPDFIDRNVDPTTGAILIQASFPNPEGLLRPGQFARVKAEVRVIKDGILIPQRCITELQGKYSVYGIEEGNKIQRKQVKVGPKVEQFWLITEGLSPGELIVYEGLQKVKEGMVVNPVVQDIKLLSEKAD
jgi:membrane fusion protein (multidrug efflux system)